MPSTLPPRTVVIIPLFNHGRTARDVVQRTLDLGAPVLVVDDGSTDGGADTLAGLTGVTVLRHPVNRGKGAALRTGLEAAVPMADWAVTLDADGQHDPADIPVLTAAIPPGRRALVIGVRVRMDAEGAPWTSLWGRRMSNLWIILACGRRFSDTQSGFRLYPLPETLDLGIRTNRYQFEIETIVRSVWRGLTVVEAPITVRYASLGERISHFHPFLDTWRNIRTYTRLCLLRLAPRSKGPR